ncbi:MAG: DUF6600 domain-containing protein [Acidobacteriota bacterium]
MKKYIAFLIPLCLLMLISYSSSFEKYNYYYGHISYAEKGTKVYRTDYDVYEDATLNLPVGEGDIILTGKEGRCEIQFDNGTVIRLDLNTELEIESILRENKEIKLDVSSFILKEGRLYVMHSGYRAFEMFQIMTENAGILLKNHTVSIIAKKEDGTFIQVKNGKVQVRYLDEKKETQTFEMKKKKAFLITLDNKVQEQEYSEYSDFEIWNEYINTHYNETHEGNYLPKSLRSFSGMFNNYGYWSYIDELGLYGWRPYYLDYYWHPYYYGYWYMYGGYPYWVSPYMWGWIPYHYGYWHWTSKWGWIWIPYSYWAPSWVYWGWFGPYYGWRPWTYWDYQRATWKPYYWSDKFWDNWRPRLRKDAIKKPGTKPEEDIEKYVFIEKDRIHKTGEITEYLRYKDIKNKIDKKDIEKNSSNSPPEELIRTLKENKLINSGKIQIIYETPMDRNIKNIQARDSVKTPKVTIKESYTHIKPDVGFSKPIENIAKWKVEKFNNNRKNIDWEKHFESSKRWTNRHRGGHSAGSGGSGGGGSAGSSGSSGSSGGGSSSKGGGGREGGGGKTKDSS